MFERDQLSSRRAFLGHSALATAGVMALGTLSLPALPARALSFSPGDARTLEFLTRLQNLQSDFFARAVASTTADGLREGEGSALNLIAQQDGEQMRWCKMARNRFTSAPNQMPSTLSGGIKMNRFKFGQLDTRDDLLREALSLKTTSASIWTGAVANTNGSELVSALASLAGVQNRHRAMLANILGEEALLAYAPTLSLSEGRTELEHYGFTMGDMA
jgi:hypothetical protein